MIRYRFSHFLLSYLLGMLIGAALLVELHGASFRNGSNTCPTSGAKQLSSTSIRASWVTVQSPAAPSANTGRLHFGDSTVTTSNGVYISPGGTYTFPTEGNSAVYDLSNIYFACSVNTDIVNFNYLQ